MADKEFILFCDESVQSGKYFSNFYGGVMVGSSQYLRIVKALEAKKKELNLFGEVKWQKVTELYLPKYEELIRCFFDEIRAGNLRIRVMFRQNADEPKGLSDEMRKNAYFVLYYQFIKYAYGLESARISPSPVKLRLYFDELPHTKEQANQFKGFLRALNTNIKIRKAGIRIESEDIAEVRSHEHILAQCLDVVLGATAFRLNDRHKEKAEGEVQRGKRTRAKEKLYKAIRDEIRSLKPELQNFNVGTSTRMPNLVNKWSEPYLHWKFTPKNREFNRDRTKAKKNPNRPT